MSIIISNVCSVAGKSSVLHNNESCKKSEVERKDVACQTNISGDIISHQLVIDETVYDCEIIIDQFGDQLDNLHV